MKKTKTRTEEYHEYFCDTCGKAIPLRGVCCLCRKDCCPKHRRIHPLDDQMGDKYDYVCIECGDKIQPYVMTIKKLQTQIEHTREQMDKVCRNDK